MNNLNFGTTSLVPALVFILAFYFAGLGHLVAADKPNVVVLFTDDQGTLDLNCFGAKDLHTPNLDKLAETGVRFTQAYAHTVCCPSRAALLTGRHPQRAGVNGWLQGDRNGSDAHLANMNASEVTIAEHLKSAGYDTALFGKWHLGAKEGHGPLSQGFDRFFGHLSGFIDNYRHCFMHGNGYHDLYDDLEEIDRTDEYYPEMMMGEALKYLESRDDSPFFMMISFNLPHYPEQPIGAFANSYADMAMPRRSYARVVSTVDDFVGRILSKLEAKQIRDDTIIIMMSDNGHSIEDHSRVDVDDHASGYPNGTYYSANGGGGYTGKWIGNKGTFLEGGLRVPAMISYPRKLPQDETRDQIVTVMDWYPTILELAGIPKPTVTLDGRSMVSVISDANANSRHNVLNFGWKKQWAVRQDDWKLISSFNRNTGQSELTLHNLADEKPEASDYAEDRPEIVKRLQAQHDTWRNELETGP